MCRVGERPGGQSLRGRLLKELPCLLTFLKVRQLSILSRGREVPLGQPGLTEPSLLLHLILGLGHCRLQPVLYIQASPLQQGQPGSPLRLAHLAWGRGFNQSYGWACLREVSGALPYISTLYHSLPSPYHQTEEWRKVLPEVVGSQWPRPQGLCLTCARRMLSLTS